MLRAMIAAVIVAMCSPARVPDTPDAARKHIRFAFWNVENLFDTTDDPKNDGDNDFLPKHGWTVPRYKLKLAHLAEVIAQIDPDVMGLVEVENHKVLDDLIETAPLAGRGYRVVHLDGADARGIDVALIFRAPLIPADAAQVSTLHPVARGTRGILEARLVAEKRVLTILVTHWPSRRGKKDSSDERKEAAQALRKIVLEQQEEAAKAGEDSEILILGDFNDDPFDPSIEEALGAVRSLNAVLNKRDGFLLYNPMWKFFGKSDTGTHYFNPNWEWHIFDQCIVTRGMVDTKGFVLAEDALEIHATDAMRDKYRRPLRFAAKAGGDDDWIEGYSDHFPIRGILEIAVSK